MPNTTPSFQDKEERRQITISSLDNLIKFHEIERMEKYNAIKFYSVFIGGGIALLAGMEKISSGVEGACLKYLAISVILIVNLLVIKKLLAAVLAPEKRCDHEKTSDWHSDF